MVNVTFSAKIAVIILNIAMALILGFMAMGFIFYFAGSALAESAHAVAVKIILLSPLTVIAALTLISMVKREFFLGLMGILLLLLLLSEVFRNIIS
jgi:hypothetical protein